MKRINILGNSCAGKSTFARQLSRALQIAHIELDALHWEPNWKEADLEPFRSRVDAAISADSWILDGNYTGKIGNRVLDKADSLIWLDPSLPTILYRFFKRSTQRALSRELLWGTCRENFLNSLWGRDALLIWILKTHSRKRTKLKHLVSSPPPGVRVWHLKTQQQINEFLEANTAGR